MKPEKKIRSARPTARLYIRKLNQFFFFAEHQFKKFKKKKKQEFESINLLANESNFETCEIHNRIDKLKVDSTYSEWRVKL